MHSLGKKLSLLVVTSRLVRGRLKRLSRLLRRWKDATGGRGLVLDVSLCLVACWTHDQVPHDVAQADDTDQTAGLRVVFAADNHQTVHPAHLDQRENGPERVLRVASDDSLEVWGTLLESLLNREVERLVRSKTNKSLSSA